MVLVVAMADLAQRIAPLLEGPRNYVLKVSDGKELRHKVYSNQPQILLLDYRIGGSVWRVVDEVPAIVERTESQPYVLVVVPWKSRAVAKAAAGAGVYNLVLLSEDRPKVFEADLGAALRVAHAARQARAVAPHQLKREGSCH